MWVQCSGTGGPHLGGYGMLAHILTFMCRCTIGQWPTFWTSGNFCRCARIFQSSDVALPQRLWCNRCCYCKLGTARQLPVPFSDFSFRESICWSRGSLYSCAGAFWHKIQVSYLIQLPACTVPALANMIELVAKGYMIYRSTCVYIVIHTHTYIYIYIMYI